jgi:beta-glucosidase
MKTILIFLINLIIITGAFSQTIDQQVDSVLAIMNLEEKVGQMTQVERNELNNLQDLATYSIGSILSGGGSSPSPNNVQAWAAMYDEFQSIALQSNLGIPIIYGIDAVHGHNNVRGAVIFPHNIGMGCTWNPELIRAANEVVAEEVAATGIDWTFSPCIAVPRNERWGRTYEGFGETPEIQKIMAKESVIGLQGNDLSAAETILACAKHFVGDGGTTDGIDQGDTETSEEELRSIHMEGYIDAIEAGVGTVMASYNSWNGEKLHGHDYLLTEVLKNELGFEGFVISDWKGVDQVDENYRTAIMRAINAGVDMVMVPDRYEVFIAHLIDLVQNNEVSEERIDDAVRRILKQKFLLNLFEEPFADATLKDSFGSQEHRSIARQVVRESMVVLQAKNDILPLKKDGQTILVAGALASNLGAQCGGWTISWQGGTGNITPGTTILEGMMDVAESSEIIYAANGDHNGSVDVAVLVIGEKTPYAEGAGDRTSLNLDATDINLIKKLKEEGIPTVALIVSGRPLIIGEAAAYADATIAVWYPGTEGDGIADILFGDFQPTGQLSHSWPKEMKQIPINVEDSNYNPLFPYKHGLQEFPTSASSDKLFAQAAVTSQDGHSVLLSLSDRVTDMNASASDFIININGVADPMIIDELSLADYDESMLLFTLNSAIEPDDEISLSYFSNNIQASDLSLDSLDQFYVFNAVNSALLPHIVPGRLEAEDFFEMNGIQTEACTDLGGGLNVGYIEPGDYMKYLVQVNQAGLYNLVSRISGYSEGKLLITFDDSIQTQIEYISTDGWQNWEDFYSSVYLAEGLYTMLVNAQTDAFNINYFDFEMNPSGLDNSIKNISSIQLFPNPVKDVFSLDFDNLTSQEVSIKIFEPSGKLVQNLHQGKLKQGINSFSFTLPENLPKGMYFIEIKDLTNRYFKKIIRE